MRGSLFCPLLILVLVAQPPTSSGIPPCGPSYKKVGDECLQFNVALESWHSADQACIRQKGRLASLKNPRLVLDYVSRIFINQEFWVGGSDSAREGKWKWLSGEHFWVPWVAARECEKQHNNPDNYNGNQNCLIVNWRNACYDDQSCDNIRGYICKAKECTC